MRPLFAWLFHSSGFDKGFADTPWSSHRKFYASSVLIHHPIILAQNRLFCAIAAIRLFILLLHNGECLHDIIHGMARGGEHGAQGSVFRVCLFFRSFPGAVRVGRQIQMEKGRVQFRPKLETPFLIPDERLAIVAHVFGKRPQVFGRISQLKDAGGEPLGKGEVRLPGGWFIQNLGRQDGYLLGKEEIKI